MSQNFNRTQIQIFATFRLKVMLKKKLKYCKGLDFGKATLVAKSRAGHSGDCKFAFRVSGSLSPTQALLFHSDFGQGGGGGWPVETMKMVQMRTLSQAVRQNQSWGCLSGILTGLNCRETGLNWGNLPKLFGGTLIDSEGGNRYMTVPALSYTVVIRGPKWWLQMGQPLVSDEGPFLTSFFLQQWLLKLWYLLGYPGCTWA